MNKPRPDSNESNPEDRITKNGLKKMKVTTYTNKLHLSFRWFDRMNFLIKRVVLERVMKLAVVLNLSLWAQVLELLGYGPTVGLLLSTNQMAFLEASRYFSSIIHGSRMM